MSRATQASPLARSRLRPWIDRAKSKMLVNCNSDIAFGASPRTSCDLTVHPELVEGFFELGHESAVTVHLVSLTLPGGRNNAYRERDDNSCSLDVSIH